YTRRGRFDERQTDHRQSAHQMAERQEFLGRKVSVRELVTKKHADDRGNRECVQNPGLVRITEPQTWQIPENQRKPGAPNKEFEDHHQKQFHSHSVKPRLVSQTWILRTA